MGRMKDPPIVGIFGIKDLTVWDAWVENRIACHDKQLAKPIHEVFLWSLPSDDPSILWSSPKKFKADKTSVFSIGWWNTSPKWSSLLKSPGNFAHETENLRPQGITIFELNLSFRNTVNPNPVACAGLSLASGHSPGTGFSKNLRNFNWIQRVSCRAGDPKKHHLALMSGRRCQKRTTNFAPNGGGGQIFSKRSHFYKSKQVITVVFSIVLNRTQFVSLGKEFEPFSSLWGEPRHTKGKRKMVAGIDM